MIKIFAHTQKITGNPRHPLPEKMRKMKHEIKKKRMLKVISAYREIFTWILDVYSNDFKDHLDRQEFQPICFVPNLWKLLKLTANLCLVSGINRFASRRCILYLDFVTFLDEAFKRDKLRRNEFIRKGLCTPS